jgi:hypothetical protein
LQNEFFNKGNCGCHDCFLEELQKLKKEKLNFFINNQTKKKLFTSKIFKKKNQK